MDAPKIMRNLLVLFLGVLINIVVPKLAATQAAAHSSLQARAARHNLKIQTFLPSDFGAWHRMLAFIWTGGETIMRKRYSDRFIFSIDLCFVLLAIVLFTATIASAESHTTNGFALADAEIEIGCVPCGYAFPFARIK
jgi:hypothetical protein